MWTWPGAAAGNAKQTEHGKNCWTVWRNVVELPERAWQREDGGRPAGQSSAAKRTRNNAWPSDHLMTHWTVGGEPQMPPRWFLGYLDASALPWADNSCICCLLLGSRSRYGTPSKHTHLIKGKLFLFFYYFLHFSPFTPHTFSISCQWRSKIMRPTFRYSFERQIRPFKMRKK